MIINNNTIIKVTDDDITSPNGHLTIPEGIIRIKGEAFVNCRKLKSITLPESLTDIEKYAFQQCIRLESINLPERISSIEEHAFSRCSSLRSISLPKGMSIISYCLFNKCLTLESIILPTDIKRIEYCAFLNCISLKFIDLPKEITTIERGAFADCRSLKSIILPAGITIIDSTTFYKCSSLEFISLPAGLEDITKCAFEGCDNLKCIVIESDDPKDIERIKSLLQPELRNRVINKPIKDIQYAASHAFMKQIINHTLQASTRVPDDILSIISEYSDNINQQHPSYQQFFSDLMKVSLPSLSSYSEIEEYRQKVSQTITKHIELLANQAVSKLSAHESIIDNNSYTTYKKNDEINGTNQAGVGLFKQSTNISDKAKSKEHGVTNHNKIQTNNHCNQSTIDFNGCWM